MAKAATMPASGQSAFSYLLEGVEKIYFGAMFPINTSGADRHWLSYGRRDPRSQ